MIIRPAAFRGGAAAAVVLSLLVNTAVGADARAEDFNLMQAEPQAETTASATAPPSATHGTKPARGSRQAVRSGDRLVPLPRGKTGSVLAQTGAVRMNCFPDELQAVLRRIGAHFGGAVVVTSGYRAGGRHGSYHRRCMAADIQIAGVSPSAIARFARSLPEVGGVGTYGHTRSVHVDIGDRIFTWHGARGRSAALKRRACCPVCAAMAPGGAGASNQRPRFEAQACPA